MSATDPAPERCDVAIAGAGILGLASAREILARRPGASVAVLEAGPEVGSGQTGTNSGVIHAGIYYEPGSLKARLCVEGSRLMYTYCEARGVPVERCGKLIVALQRSELPGLEELERRGRANGVRGLRRVSADEIREIEPCVVGVAGLHSPQTGIVDFAAVARALADDVRAAGGSVTTGCPVLAMGGRPGEVRVRHPGGETVARAAIACAGAGADRLAVLSGADPDPQIVGFRGRYMLLRPERTDLVRGLIYPVPDPRLPFLGVHLTRTIAGEVLLGPSALLEASARSLAWPGTWRMAARFWRTGIAEMRRAASRRAFVSECARYVPELRRSDALPGPSGVRAQALGRDGTLLDDFAFSTVGGALHVRNAPSPAATSSLAIAALIADRAEAELGV